ncbi:solute:sodium symporter (SSS) family transporter [Flavobacterium palustre]|uniref:Solute:sodium symporter (SSS) family transporter n=1 Tax=Flavobacterium palustre TaxID=1476463 RepID=A0ABQ1HCF5_9FLAO|nr:sodium:solute symporter [Flavobacterium palustre]GGA69338.1 solute:sodium symporter (SSS) family transporter [Flavobacterium palustre]
MNNSIYDKLTALDFIIVAVYLVILLVIGYIVSVKQSKKNETLFMAGNSLNWYNIGFNMWGTNVGPSSLLAFASIGYTTGIVAGNFEWYAFVFLLLLAIVFAPKYIASKVSTMPEYMGKRYGDSTQTILAWYAMVKILVSWLSLGLFSGGVLVRQILGIPMWQSVTVLVIFSGIFTYAGGLKAIAKVNVFQMILLIVVSLTLSYLGLQQVGGIDALIAKTPSNFWNLVRPADDAHYPWPAILLGYPVAAVAFFCTDQSMVQSVLGAKNLEQGQLGVNFIGWLKVMALPLFILPGILCAVLYPELGENSDLAYMTMVTNLFPSGMNGLVICVMIAVLVATIGSSLNALSTVFTNDIYVKKINPEATIKDQIKIGRLTIAAGCVFSILIAIAIDNIKGQNLFNIFQAVLGFLAPSLSVVFLLSIFWKRTTKKAVNGTLSWGSAFSLFVGVLYLWIFPADEYAIWPHFLLISFYIFLVLLVSAIMISLLDKNPETTFVSETDVPKTSKKVKLLFGLLGVTIIVLYLIFNFN